MQIEEDYFTCFHTGVLPCPVVMCLWSMVSSLLQVESHLSDMYTHPKTAEECLHNALKIINALRFLRMDYDIQVISDIQVIHDIQVINNIQVIDNIQVVMRSEVTTLLKSVFFICDSLNEKSNLSSICYDMLARLYTFVI